MGRLAVEVRLFGEVIEHRVLSARGSILLGDCPEAKVIFPGGPFVVSRLGNRIHVLGQELGEGDQVSLDADTFEVILSHTPSSWRRWRSSLQIDNRFLAVTVIMALAGGWIEAAEEWIERQHWSSGEWMVTSTWRTVDGGRRALAAPEAALVRVQGEAQRKSVTQPRRPDGPRHLSDDRVTGIGYHRWFKQVVPTDPNAVQADERLELDPDDVEARRIVGRAAYNADRFTLASWHYRQILDKFPEDHHARLRLAWSERRQGQHQAELGLYDQILKAHPGHALALGGSSMVAARLGRFDEAQALLEALHVVAPTHPYTDWTSSVVESARGQDKEALRSLRRAVERRDQLDSELQVELRRDIATDPTFSAMRSNGRLRALLRRHFAAASPRGTR